MTPDVVVQATGIVMRFGGVTAVNGVSLQLRRNELRCLIGPNGGGQIYLFQVPERSIGAYRGRGCPQRRGHCRADGA